MKLKDIPGKDRIEYSLCAGLSLSVSTPEGTEAHIFTKSTQGKEYYHYSVEETTGGAIQLEMIMWNLHKWGENRTYTYEFVKH